MSVYRYYLPGVKAATVTDAVLAERGIAERLRDCSIARHKGTRIEVSDFNANGPDGSSGAMVIPQPRSRASVPTIRPGQFEAHKSQHGEYWLVWDPADPPSPAGLERWETVPGVHCELGDGRLWECPTIRTTCRVDHLPAAYSKLNGKLSRQVLPEYQEAWSLSLTWSCRLLDDFRDKPVVQVMGPENAFTGSIKCLALNYRVSDEEVSLLQLLNDRTMDAVIDAAVDRAWFDDVTDGGDQKKSLMYEALSDLASFWRGLVGSTSDTSQAGQTSNSSAAEAEGNRQSHS